MTYGNLAVLIYRFFFQRNKKKAKKDATDAVHEKLLASRSLNPSNTCNALVNVTDDEDIVTRLLRENEELRSVLQAEREQNNPPREVTNCINTFQECLQRIEEKVGKIEENFQEKLNRTGQVNLKKFAELQRQMANIEDSISMFSQPYSQYVQYWLNSLPENKNVKD